MLIIFAKICNICSDILFFNTDINYLHLVPLLSWSGSAKVNQLLAVTSKNPIWYV